jgi:folate-binding protein YgfZ
LPTAPLPHRTLVAIGGDAAEDFLQGLITLDLATLKTGEARPSALLTPQGKILFDFLLSRENGGFLADIRADITDDFIRRLTLYRLRAAVTFEKRETPVSAFWNTPAPAGALRDARFPEEAGVRRLYGDTPAADADAAGFDRVRIAHGIAESGADYALSDAWPHDVLYDLNGGVGLRKGCYVGQEVVSRMHHRKTARRRVAIVSAEAPLPETGTAIEAGGRVIGTLGTVAGAEALAIVRTDRVAAALVDGAALTAGGVPVALALPAWSGLAFEAGPEGDE